MIQEEKLEQLAEIKSNKVMAIDVLLQKEVPIYRSILAFIICIPAVFISVFHLYSASIGNGEAFLTRSLIVSFIMVLGILLNPYNRSSWDDELKLSFLVDLLLIAVIIVAQVYIFYSIHIEGTQFYAGLLNVSSFQIFIGCIYTLVLLEVSRRCCGWPIVIVAVIFIMYALFSQMFPGVFQAPNTSLATMTRNLFLSTNGIFGVPVGAMLDFVVIFIIFGTVLGAAGAGEFFNNLATALTGSLKGGPAKASAVSSAFMGSISGSAVSNVVTTGSVTIPLMTRMGYRPYFAGAVEAVASTGGQILPPVMGAVAFIMAQFLGVPYVQVAIAAIIPAILYFWAAYCAVHAEAVKLNLPSLPKKDIPKIRSVLKKGWFYLIPIIVIIIMLASNQSITKTAFIATVLAFLTSFIRKETRLSPAHVMKILEQAGRACVTVIVAAAAAGVIVAAINSSGLTWRISSMLIGLAGGNLLIALVFSAVIAIILGMGVSTTAVYVLMAGILIPAIIDLGIDPMAAHLFALFYAVLGLITPPVALAAFAAAGVAGENPMKVAWTASKMALPIYLIPFIFANNPVFLFNGNLLEIGIGFITAILGIWVFVSGLWGYLKRRLFIIERIILLGGGTLLIFPDYLLSLIGFLIVVVFLLYFRFTKKI